MIRSINSCSSQQLQLQNEAADLEQLQQEMEAAYKTNAVGLEGRFKIDELRRVAEKVLKRPLTADLKADVLRATIEFAFRAIKGNYKAKVYRDAGDLYFTPRIPTYFDRFLQIKYLPSDYFPLIKDSESRTQEVEVCMTHLSTLNFWKSPFSPEDAAIIRQFKLNKYCQRVNALKVNCFKRVKEGLRDFKKWFITKQGQDANSATKMGFTHVLIATGGLMLLDGIKKLTNTKGYDTWLDPYDFRNHSTNPKDPTEFCHYYAKVPEFLSQRHELDSEAKDKIIEGLSEQFMTCQEYPISSRLIYMLPRWSVVQFSSTIAIATVTILALRWVGHAFKPQELGSIKQKGVALSRRREGRELRIVRDPLKPEKPRIEESKKTLENDEAQKLLSEIDSLKKRYVAQITSLTKDFIALGKEKADKPLEDDFQHYRKIASDLNIVRIVQSLSLLEQGQIDDVKKSLSDVKNYFLPFPRRVKAPTHIALNKI